MRRCGKLQKDIQGHPRAYRLFGDSVLDCEAKLILARAGKVGVIDVIHSFIYLFTRVNLQIFLILFFLFAL